MIDQLVQRSVGYIENKSVLGSCLPNVKIIKCKMGRGGATGERRGK